MERIQLFQPMPKERAVTECATPDLGTIAQRTDKAAQQKEESDTTVTAGIKRTNVTIGKVRQEYHHHKDEAQ